ncbi:GTPase KRas isoform X1 [Strigops habroptila]|uniref:GTPase KRas isoform X1 n=1 Tax=Strigops habroptila TaxID=2489341 RepID=UPI0011CF2A69|nr:GTPase KRas isoform X1 [Strigops habroptila]
MHPPIRPLGARLPRQPQPSPSPAISDRDGKGRGAAAAAGRAREVPACSRGSGRQGGAVRVPGAGHPPDPRPSSSSRRRPAEGPERRLAGRGLPPRGCPAAARGAAPCSASPPPASSGAACACPSAVLPRGAGGGSAAAGGGGGTGGQRPPGARRLQPVTPTPPLSSCIYSVYSFPSSQAFKPLCAGPRRRAAPESLVGLAASLARG